MNAAMPAGVGPSVNAFTDPRARMRDALRLLVQQQEPARDEASLALFRNRLLDETGSDARPLADLLLEAVRRGFRDALPSSPMEPARWDALTSPFVMRWSAERFVQPEMARWAAESWGYALGVIGVDQLRIAVPLPPVAPSLARAGSNGASAATIGVTPGLGRAAAAPRASAMPPSSSAAASPRALSRAVPRLAPSGARTPYAPPHRSSVPHLNPKFVRNLAVVAASSYLLFIGQMVFTISGERRAASAANGVTRDSAAGVVAVAPTATSGTIDSVVSVPLPAPTTLATGASPRGVPSPGVPSVTRNALPGATNSGRMLIVEPARRATGASVAPSATALTPTRVDPIAYDEMQLNDGTRMIGRVDIIRAGSVIFRDMRTGLRHEISKDDIEQIITEFGTPVRFRASTASSANGATRSASGATSGADRTADARAASTGMRARGLAGRYRVQYDAAVARGSKECTSVWGRSPQTVDFATVLHIPSADTLTIAFDGGDNFPSNVDQDGYFASTPRIMPDQARTSTALVTRLNGQFPPDGSLSLTVSIVFFRRMRSGPDLACTVVVNATGTRESR